MSTLFDAPSDRPPPPVPKRPSLTNMRSAVQECRACDLWEGATQGVMGEGARSARLMLVEGAAGVEPGKAAPFDRPLAGDKGGAVAVADQGVVADRRIVAAAGHRRGLPATLTRLS
jgi:uracil-DNA glycosylase